MAEIKVHTPLTATRLVLNAIARGALPVNSVVEMTAQSVELGTLSRPHQAPSTEVASWVQKRFPHGVEIPSGYRSYGAGRRKRHYDLFSYRANLDGTPRIKGDHSPYIIVGLFKPHEHGPNFFAFSGDTDARSGRPKWRCGSCRHPLTVAEARAKGLIQ